jgi:hypothetical protein
MKSRESYKGYVVEAFSLPLRDGAFTSHGSILKNRLFAVDDTPFETGERHPTADAAVRAGVGFAKKKIDGTW